MPLPDRAADARGAAWRADRAGARLRRQPVHQVHATAAIDLELAGARRPRRVPPAVHARQAGRPPRRRRRRPRPGRRGDVLLLLAALPRRGRAARRRRVGRRVAQATGWYDHEFGERPRGRRRRRSRRSAGTGWRRSSTTAARSAPTICSIARIRAQQPRPLGDRRRSVGGAAARLRPTSRSRRSTRGRAPRRSTSTRRATGSTVPSAGLALDVTAAMPGAGSGHDHLAARLLGRARDGARR